MSVTNEQNKVNYTATGLAVYAIPFFFEKDSHVKLYINDELKTLTTHYTLTGANSPTGGELTIVGTPPSTGVVSILREVPIKQENSLNEGGPNGAKTQESMFDRLTLIAQQINEKISRAIKMPISSELNPQLTGDVVPNAMVVVNGAGTALEMGPSHVTFTNDMNAKVDEAQSYANSALDYAADAVLAQEAALESEQNAALSAANAATSETNAASSEAAAAGSAALAQQAADSVLFNDVIFITAGMSPITLDDTYRGAMLACDCSLGPIVLNLPEISSLDLSYPWTVSAKKTDSSGNSVTINRAGSNLIDGGTTKTLGSASSGVTLIPDADPNPDVWTSAEFGASAGNISSDKFSGNGSQTAFTLSVAPGSKNNTQVFIHGVYQQKDSYSLSGTTLTFSEAPVTGTDNIEVNIGTTLAVGTPSDATVTLAKLAADVLAFLVPVGTKLESIRQDTPTGYVSGMNKSMGKTSGDYQGASYFALYSYVWAMPGVSTTAGDPFRISSAKGASALADWDALKTITIDFETNEIFTRAKGSARDLGSYQADEFKSHFHGLTMYNENNNSGENPSTTQGAASASVNNTSSTGGTETRPKNTALNVYFKY